MTNTKIDPFKGYIQEALTYIAYPFKKKRQNSKKFVILSLPRTGSSLLVELLNSHPLIQCEAELFYYRKIFPLKYLECRNRLAKEETFGFKLMPQHIERQGFHDAASFLKELYHSGYSIIKLTRRNLLLCAISLLYAEKNKKFHFNRSERDKGLARIDLDPDEVLRRLERFQFIASMQTSISEPLPHLELVYEDHLIHDDQHQDTVNLIADYLGLPPAPVFSNLARIGTENLSEYIANLDEIIRTLQATSAVQYMHDIQINP